MSRQIRLISLSLALLILTTITLAQRPLPLPANPNGLDPRGGETPLESLTPFTGSDSVDGDSFGTSISVAGDVLLVGAPFADHNGFTDAGAVYVFRLNSGNWVQAQKLIASDPQDNAHFGKSISVTYEGDASWIAVGAPNYTDFGGAGTGDDLPSAGKVYLFKPTGSPTTWSQSYGLSDAQNKANAQFGQDIELWSDSPTTQALLVGAPGEETDESTFGGAIYHYRFSAGEPLVPDRVISPINQNGAKFGFSLTRFGTSDTATIAVGSPGYDDAIADAGRVYIMSYGSGYGLINALTSNVPELNGRFGYSIDGYVNGGAYIIAVGAPLETASSQTQAGRVHIFEDSAAVFTAPPQIIQASDVGVLKSFGFSVDILHVEGVLRLAIGSPVENGTTTGQTYLFDNSSGTWAQTEDVTGSFAQKDSFGHSIAVWEYAGKTHLAVGAPSGRLSADSVDTPGIVQVFKRPSPEVRLNIVGGLPMTLNEAGTQTGEFNLLLATQPSAFVTVTADIASDECTFADISSRADTWVFTFNDTTWATPQDVAIVAIDDADVEGDHTCDIAFTVTSADIDYNGKAIAGITAVVIDNDVIAYELVRNMSMEDPVPNNAQKPQYWIFKKFAGKDRRICPGAGSPLVYTGDCSTQMAGTKNPPRSILRTTRTKTDLVDNFNIELSTDDTVRVQFAYRLGGPSAQPLMRVVAFRNFGGDRTVLARVELPHPSDNNYDQWLYFDQSYPVTTTDFKQIRLLFKDFSLKGKWWVDDVSFIYHDN